MITTIQIEKETLMKGRWLRIHIPYATDKPSLVTIENSSGSLLKKSHLYEGYNSIDISQLKEPSVNVKVETALETIFKEIKIDP